MKMLGEQLNPGTAILGSIVPGTQSGQALAQSSMPGQAGVTASKQGLYFA
jgi:hypothetical protein